MANSTDKSILTAAGKALLAQLNAEEKALVIDKMIFANVPNRPEYPQPDDVVPTDHIVHQEQVEQRGRLSADSVIYSSTLTSDVGPFDFNWTGAYCSEYGVLVTIDHHALTPKTADEPGVAGNTLVRSVVLEYKDIAEITNITVDASSWQYNATERMKKMDSDVAQSIIDQNGKDWFLEDGFLVTPSGSAYSIKAGAGYVSGNRVAMEFDRSVQVPNKPSFIYIDAHREGTPTGEQVTLFNFVVTAEEKDDYIDASTGKDVKHFVCKIAQVHADGSVSDLRPEGESATRAWVTDEFNRRQYFAPAYIKDMWHSSKDMNALIRRVQAEGGGDIVLGDFNYGIDIDSDLVTTDGYGTGWQVPFKDIGQGQSESISFITTGGTRLHAMNSNMIMLRGSQNFVKVKGNGSFNGAGNSNVIDVAFVPEDMNTKQKVSQQFCTVEPTISLAHSRFGVVYQPGASEGDDYLGSTSGSYYHDVGFNFYNVDYPLWFKEPPFARNNLTTTVNVANVKGNHCISSFKCDAGDFKMNNCRFEGMTGEVFEFKERAENSTLANLVKISDTVFEVFGAATHVDKWGVILGSEVYFINNPANPAVINEVRTASTQMGKQRYGSYGQTEVRQHVIEQAVTTESGEVIQVSQVLSASNQQLDVFCTNVDLVTHNAKQKFNKLTVNNPNCDGRILSHTGNYGDLTYVSGAGLSGVSSMTQLQGEPQTGYTYDTLVSNSGANIYMVLGSGNVLNATGTFGKISDKRTKEEFVACRDYTEDLMKLVVGTYTSKVTGTKQIGLLAQQLQEVFPSLVDHIGDLTLPDGSVVEDCLVDKSTPLIYMLINVVQAQQIRIEALESKWN